VIIIGSLAALAIAAIWILSNAISSDPLAVPITRVAIGAYGVVAGGLLGLVLSAVAGDNRVQHVAV
jgi:hypothetical protein